LDELKLKTQWGNNEIMKIMEVYNQTFGSERLGKKFPARLTFDKSKHGIDVYLGRPMVNLEPPDLPLPHSGHNRRGWKHIEL
jgi:hypothetical protein